MSSTKNSETKKVQEEKQEVLASIENERKKEVKKRESVYTVDELCSSAQALFFTRPECVRAALKEKNIMKCSRSEAEKIVRAFVKKEVK